MPKREAKRDDDRHVCSSSWISLQVPSDHVVQVLRKGPVQPPAEACTSEGPVRGGSLEPALLRRNLHYVITRNSAKSTTSCKRGGHHRAWPRVRHVTLVTFSSQLAYQESQLRAEIGADIAVNAPPPIQDSAASVRALPEVEGLTLIRRLYVPRILGLCGRLSP